MDRRYWVMRTDRTQTEYISEELRAGRMRQGWGYSEEVDLRHLAELVNLGQVLTAEQRKAWPNRRLLPSKSDSIQQGDIVLLPNLPEKGQWFIAEVADNEYKFEIPDELGDYGHIRNVRLLNPDSPINPYDEAVSASLRGTMRCRGRLWNVDRYEIDLRRLLEAVEEGRPVNRPQSREDRLEDVKNSIKERLWERLKQNFRGEEFERPCEKLLERLYDVVERTAGREEQGADFICRSSDGLGIQDNVAVQVKMWTDEHGDDLATPLKQIRKAHRHYSDITAAVIIVTLKEAGSQRLHEAELLGEELGIQVKVLLRDELLDLFLQHLSEMTEALE